jgi:P27 family predicted phage terminase small subunit
MTGRKPYPFQVLESTNKKDKISKKKLENRKKNEPTIKSCKLECPSHLCAEAKAEWERIVDLYREIEQPIVTDLDVNALEIYCESLVTYRKAMLKVRETSEVYADQTQQNKPKKNPWLAIANDAAKQMKQYGEALLLDPVSRARAGLIKDKPKSDPLKEQGFGNV